MPVIKALIVDGPDKGTILDIEWAPQIRAIRYEKIEASLGDPNELDSTPPPVGYTEYKECARGIDLEVVCYSTTGKSSSLLNLFQGIVFPSIK